MDSSELVFLSLLPLLWIPEERDFPNPHGSRADGFLHLPLGSMCSHPARWALTVDSDHGGYPWLTGTEAAAKGSLGAAPSAFLLMPLPSVQLPVQV